MIIALQGLTRQPQSWMLCTRSVIDACASLPAISSGRGAGVRLWHGWLFRPGRGPSLTWTTFPL